MASVAESDHHLMVCDFKSASFMYSSSVMFVKMYVQDLSARFGDI